uniref:Uncharacterized protein n=1 Tax=Oryza rufipogon TaxID=4529 RepID=A0A0E0NHK2_ORYRU
MLITIAAFPERGKVFTRSTVVKEEEGTHRNDASKEGNGAEGVAIVKPAIRHGKAFAYGSLSSPTH